MVRAEAGHALTTAQGLNTVDTLKYLIQRTEERLWVEFQWPQLAKRWDIQIIPGMENYLYPAECQFDQIREVLFARPNSRAWQPMEYGIPDEGLMPYNEPVAINTRAIFWENASGDPDYIKIWPIPDTGGYMRVKGMKPLNVMCEDSDCCTLDPVTIAMYTAADLLARAKSADAELKKKAADRHLQKVLSNKISAKHKVSTFGASRGAQGSRMRPRPYLDYIP